MNFYKWNGTPPSLDGVRIEPPRKPFCLWAHAFLRGMRWGKGQKGAMTALWANLA